MELVNKLLRKYPLKVVQTSCLIPIGARNNINLNAKQSGLYLQTMKLKSVVVFITLVESTP